jgi:hypothetical protein
MHPIGSTEVSIAELEALLEQARQEPLHEGGYQKLRNAVRTLGLVSELLEKQETTLAELRELLCPASTEKTAKVLERAGINNGEKKPKGERKKPLAGHGRNAAAAYGGARRMRVPHESLKGGDPCPAGCDGKVYRQRDPGLRVRIYGQAPIAATVYELARLRCKLCGDRLHRRRTARGGGEKVRRDGREHDGGVALRQRTPLDPARGPAARVGHSTAGGHTVRDPGRNGGRRWNTPEGRRIVLESARTCEEHPEYQMVSAHLLAFSGL